MLGGLLKSVAGPLVSGGLTLLGGVLQNNSAKAQAQNQMAFQEDMSNTSYQRVMNDMRLAGLNPILSAKVGGASTPSGAAAPVENVLAPAVNSANTVRMQNLTAQNLAEQNKLLQAQRYQAQTQGVLNDVNAVKSSIESTILQSQTSAKAAEADFKETGQTFLDKSAKGLLNAIDNILEGKSPIAPRSSGFSSNSAKSLYHQRGINSEFFPNGVLKPPRQ